MKFRIFPTPRYLNIRNDITAIPATIPLLTFAKIVVKVKKREAVTSIKNTGTAPKVSGSTKRMTSVTDIQRKRVIANKGKKFFLFLISFLRISLLMWPLCIIIIIFYGPCNRTCTLGGRTTPFRLVDKQKVYGVKREPETFR